MPSYNISQVLLLLAVLEKANSDNKNVLPFVESE